MELRLNDTGSSTFRRDFHMYRRNGRLLNQIHTHYNNPKSNADIVKYGRLDSGNEIWNSRTMQKCCCQWIDIHYIFRNITVFTDFQQKELIQKRNHSEIPIQLGSLWALPSFWILTILAMKISIDWNFANITRKLVYWSGTCRFNKSKVPILF